MRGAPAFFAVFDLPRPVADATAFVPAAFFAAGLPGTSRLATGKSLLRSSLAIDYESRVQLVRYIATDRR